jgi:hypothetical protein
MYAALLASLSLHRTDFSRPRRVGMSLINIWNRRRRSAGERGNESTPFVDVDSILGVAWSKVGLFIWISIAFGHWDYLDFAVHVT